MKKERIFLALCGAAAFTACTDKDLSSVAEGENTGTASVELTIASDAESRGLWEVDGNSIKFQWQNSDKIGLSMVSREQTPENVTAGDYTLTNYEFTAAIGGSVLSYPNPKGYFVTQNATVFSGTYVAYYPYNGEYCDPSQTIPVSSPYIQYTQVESQDAGASEGTTPSAATVEKRSQFSGDNTFTYSKPFAMAGGRDAKGEITLQNLSGTFQLNLDKTLVSTFNNGISYIVATTGNFTLGEEKPNAGEFPVKGDLKSVVVAPGDDAATYTDYQEALIMHMSEGGKGDYDTEGALKISSNGETVYMVALPRPNFFSEGYKFYLVDNNNKAYEIEKTAATFASQGINTICAAFQPISIKEVTPTVNPNNKTEKVYVAADGKSLAKLDEVAAGSKIYIFNNIELEEDLTFENSVTLIAAKNQGKITVPAGKILKFNAASTVDTEIVVEKATTAGLVAPKGLTIGTKGKITNNTPFTIETLTQVVVNGEYINNATFTIAAPAATTSAANRGLKVNQSGTFTNNFNSIVDNFGTVANVNGTFNNNTGAEFLDEIGSKLSGTSLNQTGEYICIVDRQERLLESIEQRPSTTIRLKECIEGTTVSGNVAYDFLNADWSKYKFEVIEGTVYVHNSNVNTTSPAKVKSLTVKAGTFVQLANAKLDVIENFTVNSDANATLNAMFTVGGNVTVGGTFEATAADTNLTERMKVDGNFTISGSATFGNNIIVRIFGANGVINNTTGKFVITDATANGKVPAIVYAKAFSGNGTWANYPTVVEDPANPF